MFLHPGARELFADWDHDVSVDAAAAPVDVEDDDLEHAYEERV